MLAKTEAKKALSWAQRLFSKYYNLEGEIKALQGEVDDNFYLKTAQDQEYILKIAPPGSDLEHLKFQNALARHLEHVNLKLPRVVTAISGEDLIIHKERDKNFYLRLYEWIPGRLLSQCNPHTPELLFSLGNICGRLSMALKGFDHPAAHRFYKWDPSQANWIKDHLERFKSEEQKSTVRNFYELFEGCLPKLNTLRQSVNYNDANDNNVIVNDNLENPQVQGVIDLGDSLYTHTINELAIVLSYSLMGKEDPLQASFHIIKGYHNEYPIQEAELEVLYTLVGVRLLLSVVVAAINMEENPENKYLQISNQSAWDLLDKWKRIHPNLAHYSFRQACGMDPCPSREEFDQWVSKNSDKIGPVISGLQNKNYHFLDLKTGSLELG